MRKIIFISILVILVALSVTGCGPSEEEIAAMTAAAASPTPLPPTETPLPTPTFTPTPMPKDLTVKVVNDAGEPVSGAILMVSSLDYQGGEVVSDDMGMATFLDLPEETTYFNISASGYFAAKAEAQVVPGPNEVTVTLEMDPMGLLPSAACAAGETPLLVEDFQDKKMQNWDDVTGKIDSGVPGIEFAEDAEQPGNWVLKSFNTDQTGHVQIGSYNQPLGNAVVRFRTRNNAGQHLHVGWHQNPNAMYIAFIYADQVCGRVEKMTDGNFFQVLSLGGYIGDGKWHTIEISTFDGVYSIWIDGVERGSWEDKQPIPEGGLFLDADFWQAERVVEFDDLSICELSAPFTSLYAEE